MMKIPNRRRSGFTLVELITVMGIMALLISVAVVQYANMTRGSAMKTAATHVRSALMLARQQAVMSGKKACFIYNSNAFTVCIQEGVGTSGSVGKDLFADYAEWTNKIMLGGTVYNLNPQRVPDDLRSSTVVKVDQAYFRTANSIWSANARYGWPIYKTMYLPKNIAFTNNDEDIVVFNGDGTCRVEDYVIGIEECIKAQKVNRKTVIVKGLTSMVSFGDGTE